MALDIQIIQTSIARLCKVIPLEKLSETMYIVQVDHATIPRQRKEFKLQVKAGSPAVISTLSNIVTSCFYVSTLL